MFECIDRARTAHYKLTSTVILRLSTASDALGDMDLSGNMTRQIEQDMPVKDDSSHIVNIGKLVEDMELKMRNLLRTRMASLFITDIVDVCEQRRSTLEKQKMLWETFEVCFTLLLTLAFHLPHFRHTTFNRGEPRKGDTSRDDKFDEAVMDTTLSAQGSGKGM